MKRQVVGTVVFGPSPRPTGSAEFVRLAMIEAMNRTCYCQKAICPDCGEKLVESPLTDRMFLQNTHHVTIPTFCPNCDRVVVCKGCGTKKIVHEPKGRVVEQEDTGDLKSPAVRRVGSTPTAPTKKKRRK